MISIAAISEAEVRAVQEGILHDSREDGRTLLQRRPVHIQVGPRRGSAVAMAELPDSLNMRNNTTENGAAASPATAAAVEEDANYDGSSVTVTLGETTVIAAASPSVVEVPHSAITSEQSTYQQESNMKEEVAVAVATDKGEGLLYISIDAAPNVVDFYAHAMGGRQGSYRRAYLATLASTVRQMFGAQSVAVQDSAGVAEARVVADDDNDNNGEEDNEEEDAGNNDDGEDEEGGGSKKTKLNKTAPTTTTSSTSAMPLHTVAAASGFPAAALYVGQGFAFRIDVDVYILQAMGGNVVSCVALAVRSALKAIRLPAVTLHESAAGISVEVDQSQPYDKTVDWSRLPLLTLCLLSPTRHYVIDPTVREELALPRQLQVAANGSGEVVFTQYAQLPSRRGDVLLVTQADKIEEESEQHAGGEAHEEETTVEDGSRAVKRPRSEENAGSEKRKGMKAGNACTAGTEMQVNDWLAVMSDAVHVCQAMIADCDALFTAGTHSK